MALWLGFVLALGSPGGALVESRAGFFFGTNAAQKRQNDRIRKLDKMVETMMTRNKLMREHFLDMETTSKITKKSLSKGTRKLDEAGDKVQSMWEELGEKGLASMRAFVIENKQGFTVAFNRLKDLVQTIRRFQQVLDKSYTRASRTVGRSMDSLDGLLDQHRHLLTGKFRAERSKLKKVSSSSILALDQLKASTTKKLDETAQLMQERVETLQKSIAQSLTYANELLSAQETAVKKVSTDVAGEFIKLRRQVIMEDNFYGSMENDAENAVDGFEARLADKGSSMGESMQRALKDMATELASMESSTRASLGKLQTDTSKGFAALGTSREAKLKALKQSMTRGVGELRGELTAGQAELQKTRRDLATSAASTADAMGDLRDQAQAQRADIAQGQEDEERATSSGAEVLRGQLPDAFESVDASLKSAGDRQTEGIRRADRSLVKGVAKREGAFGLGVEDAAGKLHDLADAGRDRISTSKEWMGDVHSLLGELGADAAKTAALTAGHLSRDGQAAAASAASAQATLAKMRSRASAELESLGRGVEQSVAATSARAAEQAAAASNAMASQAAASVKTAADRAGLVGSALDNLDKAVTDGSRRADLAGRAAAGEVRGAVASGLAAERGVQGLARTVAADASAATTAAESAAMDPAAALGAAERAVDLSARSADRAQSARLAAGLQGVEQSAGATTGEASALGRAMERGVSQFSADAASTEQNLAKLRQKAAQLNARVKAEFTAVQSALSADKLEQVKSQAELEEAMADRSKALTRLFDRRVSKLSIAAKADFAKLREERDEKVRAIMNDASLSAAEKARQIQTVDDDVSNAIASMGAEAAVDEDLIQEVHAEQVRTAALVERSLESLGSSSSAAELAELAASGKLEEQLAERNAKAKAAMQSAGVVLSVDSEKEVDKLMAESNARVAAILRDESTTAEQKQRELEQLDAGTRRALADLAAEQVAESHELEGVEEADQATDGDEGEAMSALEGMLQQGQVAWLRELVLEKRLVARHTGDLQSLVRDMTKVLADRGDGLATSLTAAEKEQALQLQRLSLKLRAMSSERAHEAAAAVTLATSAARRAEDGDAQALDQAADVEQNAAATVELVGGLGSSLQQRLQDSRDAERVAQEQGGRLASQSGAALMAQIGTVENALVRETDSSRAKQSAMAKELSDFEEQLLRLFGHQEVVGEEELAKVTKEEAATAGAVASSRAAKKEFLEESIRAAERTKLQVGAATRAAESSKNASQAGADEALARAEASIAQRTRSSQRMLAGKEAAEATEAAAVAGGLRRVLGAVQAAGEGVAAGSADTLKSFGRRAESLSGTLSQGLLDETAEAENLAHVLGNQSVELKRLRTLALAQRQPSALAESLEGRLLLEDVAEARVDVQHRELSSRHTAQ